MFVEFRAEFRALVWHISRTSEHVLHTQITPAGDATLCPLVPWRKRNNHAKSARTTCTFNIVDEGNAKRFVFRDTDTMAPSILDRGQDSIHLGLETQPAIVRSACSRAQIRRSHPVSSSPGI